MDSVKVSNYYANIFPLKELVDKLDVTGPLCMREISFCLESGGYVRNLSFKDAQQLSDKFASLKPHKIDIGAVYRTKSGFKELSNCIRRELVFDIDASDYDEIRSCCKEKKFCEKCYIIVLLSCKLLHYLMKSTTRHFNVLGSFGFNDIKWFFSGRRGLHCWIFDSRALSLSSSIRKALTNYLSTFYKRHVALSFDSSFKELFVERCLQALDNVELQSVSKVMTSLESFHEKESILKACSTSESSKHLSWYLRTAISTESNFYLFLNLLKPRVDINVTTQSNHLIKSPFSVHPSTGNICIYINVEGESSYHFKPNECPNVCKIDDIETVEKINRNISEANLCPIPK